MESTPSSPAEEGPNWITATCREPSNGGDVSALNGTSPDWAIAMLPLTGIGSAHASPTGSVNATFNGASVMTEPTSKPGGSHPGCGAKALFGSVGAAGAAGVGSGAAAGGAPVVTEPGSAPGGVQPGGGLKAPFGLPEGAGAGAGMGAGVAAGSGAAVGGAIGALVTGTGGGTGAETGA